MWSYINRRYSNNKQILRDLWDNSQRDNICIIGVPEREERIKQEHVKK